MGDEAIRLNPDDYIPYNNRGLAYEKLGKQEQAARDYAKAEKLGYNMLDEKGFFKMIK